MAYTLIIIKPDAIQKGVANQVLNMIKGAGFKVDHIREPSTLDKETVKEHYAEHADKPFYQKIVDYMISGNAIPAIIRGKGDNTVAEIRKLVGSTIPAEAGSNTIRGQFSDDTMEAADLEKRSVHNIIHASATAEEAKAEMKLWFPELFSQDLTAKAQTHPNIQPNPISPQ